MTLPVLSIETSKPTAESSTLTAAARSDSWNGGAGISVSRACSSSIQERWALNQSSAARTCGPDGSWPGTDVRPFERSAGNGTTGLVGMVSRITETSSHFSGECRNWWRRDVRFNARLGGTFNAEPLQHKAPEAHPQ